MMFFAAGERCEFTRFELEAMKHCIGLDRHNSYIRHKKRFYRPYRNYYNIAEGCKGYAFWAKLVSKGYAEEYEKNFFALTRKGLDALGDALGITIKEEQE